jgi:hypothetical protein
MAIPVRRGRFPIIVKIVYDVWRLAMRYAIDYSRSHDAVIRVYDAAGNVIETHQHKGDFKEW